MKKVCCHAFGPPENLQRIEVDAPSPQANEALVNISAAGVGFVDGLMVQGLYQVKPPLPYYPGSEFAGVVSEVGDSVINVQPGDRVLGMASSGAYADSIAVAAATLVKIPANLSDTIAAGFYINYATAPPACYSVLIGRCSFTVSIHGYTENKFFPLFKSN